MAIAANPARLRAETVVKSPVAAESGSTGAAAGAVALGGPIGSLLNGDGK